MVPEGGGQEFLYRHSDRRWFPVRQTWLDQLPSGFAGRWRYAEEKVRDDIFRVFIGLWVALGSAGFFFFLFSNNAAFKRRYFPWFAGLTGLAFIGVLTAKGIPPAMLAIRGTHFCGA